jgi:hypothetical protein
MPALRELVEEMLAHEEFSAARLIVNKYPGKDHAKMLARIDEAHGRAFERMAIADAQPPTIEESWT